MSYSLEPVNKCPHRSPMAVSEAIKDLLQDKVVCELGCAEGDNLAFMGRYAKRVLGVEMKRNRYKHAKQRGFEVVVGNYLEIDIPDADVYYYWPNLVEHDPLLLNRILDTKPNFHGIIVIAGDSGHPPEPPVVRKMARLGKLLEVPFNEGTGHREFGTFYLAIINADEARRHLGKVV